MDLKIVSPYNLRMTSYTLVSLPVPIYQIKKIWGALTNIHMEVPKRLMETKIYRDLNKD